ncbi:MAG: DUF3800 domain-containing protein [Candidatus Woesearchaeota archaeon]
MSDTYVFIDESGDLGSRGTRHSVVAALICRDPGLLDRIVKNARRNKFQKELKRAKEIKANASSDGLRSWILEKWAGIDDGHIQAVVLDTKRVYSRFLNDNPNKLYNYVCGHLASALVHQRGKLIIRIDRSKGKQALRDDFDRYLRHKMSEQPWNMNLEVHHSYSESWSGLQITDVCAWSILRKHEYDDARFYSIIENKTSIQRIWE